MKIPSSPTIHFLGAGNIGCLVATELARYIKPENIILMMRNKENFDKFVRQDQTVIVNRLFGNRKILEQKFNAMYWDGITSETLALHHSIDNLIVTTPTNNTIAAIAPYVKYLHRASTIVLIQNGLGVYEELCNNFWKDPENRPTFVLGITSHAVNGSRLSSFNFNHVGTGYLKLAVVPSEINTPEEENNNIVSEQEFKELEAKGYIEEGDVVYSSGNTKREEESNKQSSVEVKGPRFHLNSSHSNLPQDRKIDYLDNTTSTSTVNYIENDLLNEEKPVAGGEQSYWGEKLVIPDLVKTLLLTNKSLKTTLIDYPNYKLEQYEKLLINSCINPLTAILDCKNGELLNQNIFRKLLIDIINEGYYLITKELKRQIHPEWHYLIDTRFRPNRISGLVKDVCHKTSQNRSSMLQQIHTQGETEIDYINGYLIHLARKSDLKAPRNSMLIELVKAKEHLIKNKYNSFNYDMTNLDAGL